MAAGSTRYKLWRDTFEDLKKTLAAAGRERDTRRDIVDGEPSWVRYERNVMFERVNALRAARGLGPVSIEAVMLKESLACGHIDYAAKWSLGCADLVLDERTEEPHTAPLVGA